MLRRRKIGSVSRVCKQIRRNSPRFLDREVIFDRWGGSEILNMEGYCVLGISKGVVQE